MRGSDHSSLSSSRNAFSPSFLHRIAERDEPPTAGEADAAGPWHVVALSGGGFGVFRAGESPERGYRPAAVFRERWLALVAAAVLPAPGVTRPSASGRTPGRTGSPWNPRRAR
jgi:hypothetical protein